MFIWGSNSE